MIIKHSARIVGGVVAASALVGLSACGSSTSHSAGSVGPDGATMAAAAHSAHTVRSAASSAVPSSSAPTTAVAPTSAPPATSSALPASTTSSATAATRSTANSYAAAVKVVAKLGYDGFTPASAWHSDHQLNAIVGILHTSVDGKYQHLFFFVDGRYIGTDTAKPSADIGVTNGSNDVVTARYGIFKPTDALAGPSSYRSVRYEWTGSKLVPLDPIPPVATNTTAGR